MTLNDAIKFYTGLADYYEFELNNHPHLFKSAEDVKKQKESIQRKRQLAKWLNVLSKISDMLDGTIDHMNRDDAIELLNDVKAELKQVGL